MKGPTFSWLFLSFEGIAGYDLGQKFPDRCMWEYHPRITIKNSHHCRGQKIENIKCIVARGVAYPTCKQLALIFTAVWYAASRTPARAVCACLPKEAFSSVFS